MPYYPKPPEATAWWDPDEVRVREDDVRHLQPERPQPRQPLPFWLQAIMVPFGAGLGTGTKRSPLYVPRDRPDQPTRSCNACVSGKCPMSPRYDPRGIYSDGRFFELVDAMPGKKVWRCGRCGMKFRGFGGDNPANLHSC